MQVSSHLILLLLAGWMFLVTWIFVHSCAWFRLPARLTVISLNGLLIYVLYWPVRSFPPDLQPLYTVQGLSPFLEGIPPLVLCSIALACFNIFLILAGYRGGWDEDDDDDGGGKLPLDAPDDSSGPAQPGPGPAGWDHEQRARHSQRPPVRPKVLV